MARQVTLTLEYPLDGLAEITIRRPNVRDVREMERLAKAAEGDQMGEAIAVLSLLTGIAPDVIEDMDAADFTAASEAIAGFFPQAQG